MKMSLISALSLQLRKNFANHKPFLSCLVGNHSRPVFPVQQNSLKKCFSSYSGSSPSHKAIVASSSMVHEYGGRIEVRGKNWPNSLHIPHTWLRDHCRCPQCYDAHTFQRKFDVASMPLCIRPSMVAIEDDFLCLTWPDGHKTKYSLQFLWHHTHAGRTCNTRDIRTAWGARTFPVVTKIQVPESMLAKSGLKHLLTSLQQYGIGMVTEVTPDLASTQKVTSVLGPPLRTFFGEYWNAQPDLEKADSAYSTEALGAHNDSTYFSQAARVQVFHVVQASETGGRTLLVDGLRVAQIMKDKHPEAYEFFSEQSVAGEYIGDGQHHYCVHTVFTHHPVTGAFHQIRYNLYDRAPVSTLKVSAVESYYRHLKCLAEVVDGEEVQVWLKLMPGTVLFVDNWRVLHGRSSFVGPRSLAGCYIGNEDYSSKVLTELRPPPLLH